MIAGTGIDIAKIERFTKLLDNQGFLEKYFHKREIDYIRSRGKSGAQSLAGRFAAREAFFKALGTGFHGFNLKDIEVVNSDTGRPGIIPYNRALEALNSFGDKWSIHLSISHEKEFAIAQVILEIL